SAAAKALSTAVTTASTLTPASGGTAASILYVDPVTDKIIFSDPPPNFTTGEELIFHQAAGNSISPLVDGTHYFAIAAAGDGNAVQLALTSNSLPIQLDASSQLTGTTAGDIQTLDILAADPTTSSLLLVSAPGSTVHTGDTFVYHAGVGNGISGLV